MKYMLSNLMVLLLLLQGCEPGEAGQDGGKYRNPVFEPDMADPAWVRTGDGWFYAYGTENTWESGHQVVPVARSADLVNWDYVGEAFETKPGWKDGWIWAPEIAFLEGEYVLFYAFSLWGDPNPAIGVATSGRPEGPFTDHGKLLDSESMNVANSIDPSIYTEDGTVYLIWGSLGGGIHGIELAPDGRSMRGEKFPLAGTAFEAPCIFRKEGYYYLFLSTATCCEGAGSLYRVVVGRSENLRGPYRTINGHDLLDYNGGWWPPDVDRIDGVILAGNSAFAGPGHNGQVLTDDGGQDWFIYHAIERTEPYLPRGATRRPLCIDRLEWVDGWPVINGGQGPSSGENEKPSIL